MSIDRRREKRGRILDAARELFLRQGLRATTMEAIARAAHMAKATLYAEFPDKDAVFLAILEHLVAEKLVRFEAALAGPEPLVDRIGAALAAEFGVIAEALAGSAHAEELFSAHRLGSALFAASDRTVRDRVTTELSGAGVSDPARLARLVLDASFGVAQKSIAADTLAEDLKLLARRLLGPELT